MHTTFPVRAAWRVTDLGSIFLVTTSDFGPDGDDHLPGRHRRLRERREELR